MIMLMGTQGISLLETVLIPQLSSIIQQVWTFKISHYLYFAFGNITFLEQFKEEVNTASSPTYMAENTSLSLVNEFQSTL